MVELECTNHGADTKIRILMPMQPLNEFVVSVCQGLTHSVALNNTELVIADRMLGMYCCHLSRFSLHHSV